MGEHPAQSTLIIGMTIDHQNHSHYELTHTRKGEGCAVLLHIMEYSPVLTLVWSTTHHYLSFTAITHHIIHSRKYLVMTMSIQGEWVQNECVIRETGKKIVERDKGNSSNRQFVVWFCHFFFWQDWWVCVSRQGLLAVVAHVLVRLLPACWGDLEMYWDFWWWWSIGLVCHWVKDKKQSGGFLGSKRSNSMVDVDSDKGASYDRYDHPHE